MQRHSCDNIYERILRVFLSVRRHASRGYIWILLHYNSDSYLFCSLLWSVMFGFRQVIQVEERTQFCLHGIF